MIAGNKGSKVEGTARDNTKTRTKYYCMICMSLLHTRFHKTKTLKQRRHDEGQYYTSLGKFLVCVMPLSLKLNPSFHCLFPPIRYKT